MESGQKMVCFAMRIGREQNGVSFCVFWGVDI